MGNEPSRKEWLNQWRGRGREGSKRQGVGLSQCIFLIKLILISEQSVAWGGADNTPIGMYILIPGLSTVRGRQ
jgi:hypothetical protein